MSDAKLDQILVTLQRLEQDFAALKADVGSLKAQGAVHEASIAGVTQRLDDMLGAFRAHWSEMSGLYRSGREDLKAFEDRMEAKLGQLAQRIQGLAEALEARAERAAALTMMWAEPR